MSTKKPDNSKEVSQAAAVKSSQKTTKEESKTGAAKKGKR
jgi:hypothetical protein